MMKAQDFLKQLKKLDKMIENKLIEVEQWKAIASGTGTFAEGERVQSSGSQQKMADAVARYVDFETELNATIDTLVDTKKDVISVIERLDAEKYDVLHKVYVQYLTFEEVAHILGKSKSWIAGKHGTALKEVQNILDGRSMENKDET